MTDIDAALVQQTLDIPKRGGTEYPPTRWSRGSFRNLLNEYLFDRPETLQNHPARRKPASTDCIYVAYGWMLLPSNGQGMKVRKTCRREGVSATGLPILPLEE